MSEDLLELIKLDLRIQKRLLRINSGITIKRIRNDQNQEIAQNTYTTYKEIICPRCSPEDLTEQVKNIVVHKVLLTILLA